MKSRGTLIVAMVIFYLSTWAEAVTLDELMQDKTFKQSSPEQRLQLLHKQIAEKKIKKADVRKFIESVYRDALPVETDPVTALKMHQKLKKKYNKLPYVNPKFISALYWRAISGEKKPEARLARFAQIITANKQFPTPDKDFIARLYWEVLVEVEDGAARLKKYSELKAQHRKLPRAIDVERLLVIQYLATDPKAVQADVIGKIKLIYKMEKARILSWQTTADLYTGMLALHLASDQKYQRMDANEKLKYLKGLVSIEGVVGSLSTTLYAKGVAFELLAGTDPERRNDLIETISPALDTFTKTSVSEGFIDTPK
ncbi:hypothetical protein ACFLZM_04005 [Thermodesulfobacteriota bacterium]